MYDCILRYTNGALKAQSISHVIMSICQLFGQVLQYSSWLTDNNQALP